VAARRTADNLMSTLREDGAMPGRFLPGWLPAVESVCLTGVAQVAHCWLLMHAFTGEARYRDAARLANRFVRRTVSLDGPPETRGGIKGSFPIDGDYAPYEYVSWAAKFAADSLMLEMDTAPSPRIESASYHHRAAERLRTSDLLALALHAHGTVLDVGARDGYHARLLADRFDQVTALDLTVPVIADPRIDCVAGDVTNLPFGNDSFPSSGNSRFAHHRPLRSSRHGPMSRSPFLKASDAALRRLSPCRGSSLHQPALRGPVEN